MSVKVTRSTDSLNWTALYVLVSLIPVVFAVVVAISVRRDKATQRKKHDIEMALHQRSWFPWRETVAGSERVRPPPPALIKPPIPPPDFGRPTRVTKDEGLTG
ncbi:hypothetical protein F4806DRAFT_301198 [Annulohypoxylon nitens]|nr:hypothetical protein F4806DRAFT_301198 [Annulohypoxylon nitens]